MKKTAYISAVSLLITVVLFLSTNPNMLPSYLLVVPFLTLFFGLSAGLAVFLNWTGLSPKRSLRLGGFYASLPIILMILQSIGQLTIQDVVTIVILFSISYFYLSRTTATP